MFFLLSFFLFLFVRCLRFDADNNTKSLTVISIISCIIINNKTSTEPVNL